jgi:rhodanese-related sulfurtransferase
MNTISRNQLRALLDTGHLALIEALPAASYPAEHLPGARTLPGDLTCDLTAQLTPGRATVVVYCSGPGCGRSRVTAASFARPGYTDVRVYPGGKSDWADAGLPFEGAGTDPAIAAA